MATNYEKLRAKLEEMFMLDRADLDFGIYRIMNSKRDEILRFLDNDLLPQVRQVLQAAQGEIGTAGADELKQAEDQARALGVDPATVPKVQELRAKYAGGGDLNALEQEVFNHLYSFFRRYYDEGDFLSLRRYKEGVYAIPYEGEEVKLHWANADQYYIKTAEHFRDYAFLLPSPLEGRGAGGEGSKKVHFKLVDAETDKDNNKASEKRVFILTGENAITEENGELLIRFEYRAAPDKRKQKEHSEEAVARILDEVPGDWKRVLQTKAATEKNPNRTVLEKHITDYTARNTFDYFIHKDLGGFLRRELDFYIKNEVMHLDDIEHESCPKVEQYLAKVRAIRWVAGKLIDFLAQLEDFQKRLWLKKKFIVDTQYLVSLDRVPKELLSEAASNAEQRAEWALHLPELPPVNPEQIELWLGSAAQVPVVDTRFFSEAFKAQVLRNFPVLDTAVEGVAVQSDNFHALTLLHNRFADLLQCCYIDPPFNTGDDFFYKDSYRFSSWCSLMRDRLSGIRPLLSPSGSMFLHLDHNANYYGRLLLNSVFGASNFVNEIVWRIGWVSGYKTQVDAFVRNHDTLLFYAKDDAVHRFNKSQSRIPYRSFERDSIQPELDAIFRKWDIDPRRISTMKVNFKYGDGQVFKVGLANNEGGYNIEDTWNCSEYEELNSNKIKRNASEYTPNGSLLTQKPEELLQRVISLTTNEEEWVLDCFAGAGTTAAVAWKTRRKFITVEMGHHFDNDVLWRFKQCLSGRTVGISRFISPRRGGLIKYLRLESYEDTLANLNLTARREQQGALLEQHTPAREDYTLRYCLTAETEGSRSLLNVQSFGHPFSYTLDIATDTVGETRKVNVDLVETFNWLLGLRVHTMDVIRGFHVVTGRLPGPGNNENGEKALIIWRDLDENPNEKLDEFFRKQAYNTLDQEFDVIYVNGDNNLQNLRKDDQSWKVRLIEEEFHRLMWDVEDV